MTLRDHLRAALVRWPLVLGLFVLGLLIGTVVALAQPTTWSSSTLVAIGPRTTSTSTPSSTTIALQDPSIRSTLAQIAMSPATVSSAVVLASAKDLSPKVTAVVVNDSNVIEIRGTAAEGPAAEELSRAATAKTSTTFERLYPLFVVATVSPAASAKEEKASVLTAAVLGGAVGLFLGYLLALAAEAARRSLAARAPQGAAAADAAASPPPPPAPGDAQPAAAPSTKAATSPSARPAARTGRDKG